MHTDKVFFASADAKNEKGTPVKIRDYTRSCEFRDNSAHSKRPLPTRREGRTEETSQKTCLFPLFQMPSGDKASGTRLSDLSQQDNPASIIL